MKTRKIQSGYLIATLCVYIEYITFSLNKKEFFLAKEKYKNKNKTQEERQIIKNNNK